MKSLAAIMLTLMVLISGCATSESESSDKLSLDYEKFTLDNGLDVVLHQDDSDPIVAVAIQVHVGSNREKPGRTGFAHFFEHMLFQRSENVPDGGFFKNIDEWGGTFNGGTGPDGTIYFEVVPKDALEKVLWMESDRMGFFINAVSLASLEGEKPVVQNEKRQGVDNRPYGHTQSVILKALYPEGHPYSWTVIGELEDLQNATLDDVKEFYEKWYGPNNATLVIAGDIDKEGVKALVDKYFGEIPSRGIDTPMNPQPVTLDETKVIYYEDNFAQLPELRMTFPTVEQYHPDQWALNALGQILSNGKRAALYKAIVEDAEVAPGVSSFNRSSELAGTFTIRIRANAGTDLDSVRAVVNDALIAFDRDGFNIKDLDRIKASLETNFYNGISSVLGKAFRLARYNEYAGNPGFLEQDIENIKAVTQEDVMRVFRKYILNKNMIVTNFVPKGASDLAMEGAQMADIKEEGINEYGQSEVIEEEGDFTIVKTESSFDRSKEPDFGEKPLVTPPTIWTDETPNGISVYGVEANELPLVNFSMRIMGGHYLDDPEKVGVANLMTDIMMEGTANKTPEELEDAIGQLGANLNMFTTNEYIQVSGNCLARNFEATMELVQEILLEPRWDEAEFDRIINQTLQSIKQRETNPNSIATVVMNKKLYGDNHIMSHPSIGYEDHVQSITIDDLKSFYSNNFAPNVTNFHIAGKVTQSRAIKALGRLTSEWTQKEVSMPSYSVPAVPSEPQVYFVDVPNAKQSVIRMARLTVPANDPVYNEIMVANDRLGDGSSGRLFQVLREEKQFTYGAYAFPGRNAMAPGTFAAFSSVKSSTTKDALDTFKEVIGNYAETYTDEDLAKTQTAMIKENARNFETLFNLLGILENISTYNLPMDYIDQEQKTVTEASISSIQATANEYFDLSKYIFVIVGDKATQFDQLRVDGPGDPVLVDRYGKEEGVM
ncbi:M16 family metallopeptidase [Ekhidna sp. To15]|uniref:M16 family metallopeptidase n=1 Tax=Ekhidna sp. To15 TaxID=3395267 RepID=UPI003F528B24